MFKLGREELEQMGAESTTREIRQQRTTNKSNFYWCWNFAVCRGYISSIFA